MSLEIASVNVRHCGHGRPDKVYISISIGAHEATFVADRISLFIGDDLQKALDEESDCKIKINQSKI